jgi:rhodanese-related sulfurtransferase
MCGFATLDEMLHRARRGIDRLTPAAALAAQREGALIIDIRPLEQRRRDGCIEGAVCIDRNVLEWRLAPTSPWRLAETADRTLIVLCNQGFQSSLAAFTLRELGLLSVADIDGGFEAWRAAGLPTIAIEQAPAAHL